MTEKTVGDEISNKNVFGSSLMVVYVSVRGRQLKIFCFKGEMGVCPGRTNSRSRSPGIIHTKGCACPGRKIAVPGGFYLRLVTVRGRTTSLPRSPGDIHIRGASVRGGQLKFCSLLKIAVRGDFFKAWLLSGGGH